MNLNTLLSGLSFLVLSCNYTQTTAKRTAKPEPQSASAEEQTTKKTLLSTYLASLDVKEMREDMKKLCKPPLPVLEDDCKECGQSPDSADDPKPVNIEHHCKDCVFPSSGDESAKPPLPVPEEDCKECAQKPSDEEAPRPIGTPREAPIMAYLDHKEDSQALCPDEFHQDGSLNMDCGFIPEPDKKPSDCKNHIDQNGVQTESECQPISSSDTIFSSGTDKPYLEPQFCGDTPKVHLSLCEDDSGNWNVVEFTHKTLKPSKNLCVHLQCSIIFDEFNELPPIGAEVDVKKDRDLKQKSSDEIAFSTESSKAKARLDCYQFDPFAKPEYNEQAVSPLGGDSLSPTTTPETETETSVIEPLKTESSSEHR